MRAEPPSWSVCRPRCRPDSQFATNLTGPILQISEAISVRWRLIVPPTLRIVCIISRDSFVVRSRMGWMPFVFFLNRDLAISLRNVILLSSGPFPHHCADRRLAVGWGWILSKKSSTVRLCWTAKINSCLNSTVSSIDAFRTGQRWIVYVKNLVIFLRNRTEITQC